MIYWVDKLFIDLTLALSLNWKVSNPPKIADDLFGFIFLCNVPLWWVYVCHMNAWVVYMLCYVSDLLAIPNVVDIKDKWIEKYIQINISFLPSCVKNDKHVFMQRSSNSSRIFIDYRKWATGSNKVFVKCHFTVCHKNVVSSKCANKACGESGHPVRGKRSLGKGISYLKLVLFSGFIWILKNYIP